MKKDAQAEQAVNELEVKKRSQLSYIWFRFRKNKLAMVGMFLLLVMALICVTAPLYLDYNDDVVTQHVMENSQSRSPRDISSAPITTAAICLRVLSTAAEFLFPWALPSWRCRW